MTALVILPGLDGTGTQHAPFIDALGDVPGAVTVVRYPRDQALDYKGLEALARAALPVDVPFVLLGESFSGPIAISIAADPPPNMRGLVLSTTFARAPVPVLSPFAAWLPPVSARRVPMNLLSWLLLGRWATPDVTAALRCALSSVPSATLRHRAALTLAVDVSPLLQRITLPVLYLRARGDRLIRPAAGREITAAIRGASLLQIEGPHLLLQACPQQSAQAVAAFLAQQH